MEDETPPKNTSVTPAKEGSTSESNGGDKPKGKGKTEPKVKGKGGLLKKILLVGGVGVGTWLAAGPEETADLIRQHMPFISEEQANKTAEWTQRQLEKLPLEEKRDWIEQNLMTKEGLQNTLKGGTEFLNEGVGIGASRAGITVMFDKLNAFCLLYTSPSPRDRG